MKKLDLSARLFRCLHSIKRSWLSAHYTCWGRFVAKCMGVELGRGVKFHGPISIDRFKYSRIVIGDGVIFNSHRAFNPRGCQPCILQTATDCAQIEIGAGSGLSGVSIVAWQSVKIGQNVMIGTGTVIGDTDDHPERLGTKTVPVEIGNNVFIGMHTLVLKGVTIGDNAVIGAGSVVTQDIPANCVAAGVPCRVIRMK